MNTITITINGMEYNLKGKEKEEYLRTVGNYVDKKIKNILENNEKLSTSDAAILTALNVADDMFKLGNDNEKLADDVELMRKKVASLEENKRELEEGKKKLEDNRKELRDKIDSINKKNTELLSRVEKLENTDNQDLQDEIVKLKEEINKITKENEDMKDSVKNHIALQEKYKKENKDLKFNVHTLKYKVMDLENKFLENQINLAKAKKQVVEVLNDGTKNKRNSK